MITMIKMRMVMKIVMVMEMVMEMVMKMEMMMKMMMIMGSDRGGAGGEGRRQQQEPLAALASTKSIVFLC